MARNTSARSCWNWTAPASRWNSAPAKSTSPSFPPRRTTEILREWRPLGGILRDFGMAFSSRPGAYFRVAADSFIGGALGLSGAPFLFGRRNTLLDARERPLAEIVEILPP